MTRREPDRVQAAHYQCECGASPPVTQLDPYTFAVSCPCGRELQLSWRSDGPPPVFQAHRRGEAHG
jgi:hypothetical protein